jgi:hypothetical protein
MPRVLESLRISVPQETFFAEVPLVVKGVESSDAKESSQRPAHFVSFG